MSNWRTAKRTVQEMLHRHGTSDPDINSRAICEAIRHYSSVNFYFNQGTYDFLTTDGENEYGTETESGAADGYPQDMVKPIKMSLQVSSTWYDISPISIDYYRDLFQSTSYKGFPEKWAWFSQNIMLEPTPNDEYTVRLDYIKDIGSPVASYSGTAWSFLVGGSAVAETYTNGWFVQALDLIVSRSVYFVATQYLQNNELAMFSKAQEMEKLSELLVGSETSEISPEPRPWQ